MSTPMPDVALAWGSKSHSKTRFPRFFSAAVIFTVVVVFAHTAFLIDNGNDLSHGAPPCSGQYGKLHKHFIISMHPVYFNCFSCFL